MALHKMQNNPNINAQQYTKGIRMRSKKTTEYKHIKKKTKKMNTNASKKNKITNKAPQKTKMNTNASKKKN